MDTFESLNHSVWECKYHVLFIPKCRRKTLYGELRRYLGEVFRTLAQQKESRIEEGHSQIQSLGASSSTLQVRELRIDPALDELVELGRFLHNLLGFGFCRDVRARVVDHITLAAAGLEVVGVLVGVGAGGEPDALERNLVMAGLGGHAVAGAGNRHVRCQQCRVVCRCELPIRREACDSGVSRIARDKRADVIELVFRSSMMLDVVACQ